MNSKRSLQTIYIKLIFSRRISWITKIVGTLIFLYLRTVHRDRKYICGLIIERGLDSIPQAMHNEHYLYYSRDEKRVLYDATILESELYDFTANKKLGYYINNIVYANDKNHYVKKSRLPIFMRITLVSLAFSPFLRKLLRVHNNIDIRYNNWGPIRQHFVDKSLLFETIKADTARYESHSKGLIAIHCRTDRFKRKNGQMTTHSQQSYRNSSYRIFDEVFNKSDLAEYKLVMLGDDNSEFKRAITSRQYATNIGLEKNKIEALSELITVKNSLFWCGGNSGARWFAHLINKPGIAHNCIPFTFELCNVLPNGTMVIPKILYRGKQKISFNEQWEKLPSYNYDEEKYLENLKGEGITKIVECSADILYLSIRYFMDYHFFGFKFNSSGFRDLALESWKMINIKNDGQRLRSQNIFVSPFLIFEEIESKKSSKNEIYLKNVSDLRNYYYNN